MSKIIMMRGLPASGKSTEARRIVEAGGNFVRVSKDNLREMLHFEKFNGENERITNDAEVAIVRMILKEGKNVVIDDTNLGGHKDRWQAIAAGANAKFEVRQMATDYKECMRRDELREDPVGRHVIYQMAMQNNYIAEGTEFTICDIDGTLADLSHRMYFLYDDIEKLIPKQKKDWGGFFRASDQDRFRSDVWAMVKEASPEGNIILVSARPEDYRNQTTTWLLTHDIIEGLDYKTLIMRKSGDRRDDDIVKKEILDRYFRLYKIRKVFDDRPRVIRMWRENGLDVVDVGSGREF